MSNPYAFVIDTLMAAMVRAAEWYENGLARRRSSPACCDFLTICFTQQAAGEVFLADDAAWLASPCRISSKTRVYTTAS